MVRVIMGVKGTGKTKQMIDLITKPPKPKPAMWCALSAVPN